MRILGPIVQAFVPPVLDVWHDLPLRRAVGSKLVGDHHTGCTHPAKLSITHIVAFADRDTESDVVQAGQAAPDDHVTRWWIMVAGEIAAEHGDLQQIGGERGSLETRSRSGCVDPLEAAISAPVRTLSGAALGLARADIVRKNMRQLTTAIRARNFANLSAVSSLAASARHPDFMTL